MRFEQMRAVFGTLMAKAKVNLPAPLQIVAFRSSKEMRQVSPIFKGKPTQDAGLFQGGADRCFIMLDMSTENPWTVVFHEYAHLLMNGNSETQFDPWFEEGFAEYFSSIEVDGKQARVGKIPHDDYEILQQVGMMRVADLLRVQQYSDAYNETGDRRSSFYSESGMLMHYIYDHQLLPKVASYFELKINQHMSAEAALQQGFGMTSDQLDKALRSYIYGRQYKYYQLAAPANISSNTYSSRPLTNADAKAIMADIHLHSQDYRDKAVGEFQEILKSEPNNASACRGLGYAYLQKRDFNQAAEYFKRASEMDSQDPRVHYYYALLMTRESGFSSRADIAALTHELETSISLDPNFADSYALLAFAQSTFGEPEKALESMRKALVINPRNESYRFNLANIYMANRQLDKATEILMPLQNSSNPQIAARASAFLEQVRHTQESLRVRSQPVLQNRGPAEQDSAVSYKTSTPSGPVKFLSGTLMSVDCSSPPLAALTIASAGKTRNMQVDDVNHLVLIGADKFSCSWAKEKVSVNYRETSAGEAKVVSLEIR